MTQLEIFISDCQTKADQGITHMTSEMLSSWGAIFDAPDLGTLGTYDFSVPEMPSTLPEFSTAAVYIEGAYDPHKNHVWEATEMELFEQAIIDAINSGGVGISPALQNAMFNQDRYRKQQILNDALAAVDAGVGGRGFRMRNDDLAVQRQEVILKYQWDMEQLNRDITKLMEEHARTNWQFCIEKGISAEQFHADFANKYDDLFVKMTGFALEKYKAELDADLLKFKAEAETLTLKWEMVKTRMGANATALGAEIERMKLEVTIASEAAKTQIGSHTAEVTRLVHAYAAYADLVKAYAMSASGGAISVQKI
jgi:hypothetical protein